MGNWPPSYPTTDYPSALHTPTAYVPTGFGQPPYGPGAYKGARYNLPPLGPGSLASQWTRFGARILDGLILLPVLALIEVPAFVYLFSNLSTLTQNSNGTPTLQMSNFARAEGIIWLCTLLAFAVELTWEAFATQRWGRTPGKALVHIRPLKSDQTRPDWRA